MSITAIIPAKAKSSRVPYKNTRRMADGMTLVERTITEAKRASVFNDVVVSTDSDAIAGCALAHNAGVVFRDPKLSRNGVGAGRVALAAAAELSLSDDDHVVMLLPTSPFRTATNINEAVSLYLRRDPGYSAVISVSPIVNPASLCYEAGDGLLSPLHIPRGFHAGRWDQRSPVYDSNGAVQVAGFRSLHLAKGNFWKIPKRIPYVMDPWNGWEIDEPWQWVIANTIIEADMLSAKQGITA